MSGQDFKEFNPDGIKELIDSKYSDKEYTAELALEASLEVATYNQWQLNRINMNRARILELLDKTIKVNNYGTNDLYSVLHHVLIHSSIMQFINELSPVEGKIGRNVPCPCRSGKKYKNCCMMS